MRVFLINNFFSKEGGAENSVYRTALLLRQNGHEVYFFATDKKPYFEENYELANYFPEYIDYSKLSELNQFKHIFNPLYNSNAKTKFKSLIEKIKPDILHYNNIYYYLTPSILEIKDVPKVMTLRDVRLMCPGANLMIGVDKYCENKLCFSGNSIHCFINKCKDKNYKKSLIGSIEYTIAKTLKLYDKIDYFICPSKAMFELAQESGIKKEKLVLINNFVDDKLFENQPEYTNKGYFLYIGRLAREKGVHYLLEAMSKNLDIKLHIVGNGPEEENLKAYSKELNLNNVEFLGFKADKELEEEYKGCISTILPCNWFEVFGLTNIESFIYGKPVIASNIGGIPEIVEHNINGLLFDAGNIDELSDAIRKLYQNNSMVIEMGKNGREKAEKFYNSQVFYDKLINLYSSLL